MKHIKIIKLIILTLCFIPLFVYSQGVKIEITKLETVNNKLVITYEFAEEVQDKLFDVWVEITTLSGRRINARTLSGDIGDNLIAAKKKQIIWDFVADDIVMDEEINIEVKALASRQVAIRTKNTTTGQAVLRSAVFPGWGLAKINKGKPYWIMGVSSYLLAGGAIILNQKADKEYTNYAAELDPQISDYKLNRSKYYDKMSKASAYAALSIWSINLIWTAVKASKNKEVSISDLQQQRFILYSSFDQKMGTAGFTLHYNF